MATWKKIIFKGAGVISQVADALINPEQAGYGSDVVRALDETVGDVGYLKKLHVVWTRTPPTGGTEDVAVCTFHLARSVGDEPSTNWTAAEYAAAEVRFDTWWGAVKDKFPTWVVLSQYRWYKSGPAWPISGPAVRLTARSVAGTGVGQSCPPQVAASVTEVTRIAKSWGRFYLPAVITGVIDGSGRLGATHLNGTNGLLTKSVTLYDGLNTDGTPVVVYSAAKPARKTKRGLDLPPQPARALAVESLQVDDTLDVIRSRRYEHGATKTRTNLA